MGWLSKVIGLLRAPSVLIKNQKNREKGAARTAKFINTATTVVIQNKSQARPSHWLSRMVVGGLKKA